MTGINILVSEINGEIESHAKIVNTMSNLSISYNNKNNLTNLVHIICRNSNVLLCMKFYITNKNNRPFLIFTKKIFSALQVPTESDNPAKNIWNPLIWGLSKIQYVVMSTGFVF